MIKKSNKKKLLKLKAFYELQQKLSPFSSQSHKKIGKKCWIIKTLNFIAFSTFPHSACIHNPRKKKKKNSHWMRKKNHHPQNENEKKEKRMKQNHPQQFLVCVNADAALGRTNTPKSSMKIARKFGKKKSPNRWEERAFHK